MDKTVHEKANILIREIGNKEKIIEETGILLNIIRGKEKISMHFEDYSKSFIFSTKEIEILLRNHITTYRIELTRLKKEYENL